jgi:hypothetical protein
MTHPKWQGLRTFPFHAPRACVRACARARVINRLLIYGRILFKYAVNMLPAKKGEGGGATRLQSPLLGDK